MSTQDQFLAAALVALALGLGWFVMWKLVLIKIPLVRAMAALPELPKEEPPSPGPHPKQI